MRRVPLLPPTGHVRYVALTRPPPIWKLPPRDASRRGQYFRKTTRPNIPAKDFKGWRNVAIALSMCVRLKASGSVLSRQALREHCEFEHRRKCRSDKHYAESFKYALYGAQKNGWVRSFDIPKGILLGRLPGAPCAHCGCWLTPNERAQIGGQDETPYDALEFDVWLPGE